MDWLRTLLSRCKAFLMRKKLDQELDEEFRLHLDLATKENRRRGLPEHEATDAALREFGGVTQIRESYRLRRGLPLLLDTLAQDVRFAVRQILRFPAFTAVAIITLRAGTAGNRPERRRNRRPQRAA
jgi:macrolide transport system ATP-binding/permease protein